MINPISLLEVLETFGSGKLAFGPILTEKMIHKNRLQVENHVFGPDLNNLLI